MRSTFFGSSERPLYGVHHAPSGPPRDVGVVLFYPGVHEYSAAHWAMRTLALTVAATGFPTFRFDYRGTGDSAGEPGEATVESWVEDARAAHEEIKHAAGVERVAFVGLRLGAVVAALATTVLPAVESLLLWEPVVSGVRYLEELELLDETLRLRLMHPFRRPGEEQLAGYEFPERVRRSIAAVDLCSVGPRAGRVEAVVSDPRGEVEALRRAFERMGTEMGVHPVGGKGAVRTAGARQSALIAGDAVVAIAARIERKT
jgi:pimeloyl-ACP methyl ester carboxylesterase